MKGGARSQQLIDSSEIATFEAMATALNTQYSSSNPLIKMQIERIAKIKVQLDRVQNLIDKAFEETNLKSVVNEHLMSVLKLDDAQRKTINETADIKDVGESNKIDLEKLELAHDLLKNQATSCQTHDELFSICPKFCEYVYNQARLNHTTTSNFVSLLASAPDSYDELQTKLYMKLGLLLDDAVKSTDMVEMKEAVKAVPIEQLINAVTSLINYPNTIKNRDLKIEMYRILAASNLVSEAPNFDALNNLYRYQTTLQKQLSTTMGELLALDSKEHR